ncbi:DUF4397 domain-containing protein [Chitinophaga sp. Cy-1792]|uniref:DUF4397 domain-containing protein n=1 Tax=Chitinophaga sp. Cy-1792 TaxID=2608339 RepID=UPI00142440B7|nr:DUF4397 domain-containing protein [Chitinophaga sp. Cy-1792]NIG55426.1 DUF4397 domain-containing protein [Chitinophaga sp. Cy-1792]
MKKQLFIYALLSGMMLMSCGKQDVLPRQAAAVNIMNAVVGSSYLATNFKGGLPYDYYYTFVLGYADASLPTRHYSMNAGEQPIWIYNYPDTTAKDEPLVKLNLHLAAGSIHMVYVTGTLAKPDTLLTEESLPYHPAGDSTTSIRFINLSPGSGPVKVVQRGKSAPEAASLPFKTQSAFITYPVNAHLDEYVFEFRDAATDALITTFTTTGVHYPPPSSGQQPWLYQNRALALIGIPGGTGKQKQQVMIVKY